MSELTTKKKTPLKLSIAALATAGLVLSGASAASAADFQIDIDDIAGFENGDETSTGYNYDQWHIGSVSDSGVSADASVTMLDQGVEFLELPAEATASITQVMKGYPIEGRPLGSEGVPAAINSISIDVESGSVTLQLPFFDVIPGEDGATDRVWVGTFRNAVAFGEGVHSLTPDAVMMSTHAGWPFEEGEDTLADFFQSIVDYEADTDGLQTLELLGIGFTGTPGTVVNSITFDGNTYYFGSGDVLPETPVDDEDEQDGGDLEEDEAVEDDDIVAPTPPESVETGIL